MLRLPGILVPASGYDTDMEHKGSWPYALFCGYRREARMHLIYEPGYVPNDLGGLAQRAFFHHTFRVFLFKGFRERLLMYLN